MKFKNKMTVLSAFMLMSTLGVSQANTVSNNVKTTTQSSTKTVDVVKLNAKTYGKLKGDGSDETEAIRNLFKNINKNYSDKTVEVTFPEGVYRVTGRVTVYSNTKVIGVPNKTIFKNTSESAKTKAVFTNGIDGKWDYKGNAGSNIEFRDLTFDRCLAISLGHGQNILINRIHLKDQPNAHGIEINACKNVTIKDSIFDGLDRKNTTEKMATRDYNESIQLDSSTYASYPYFGSYAGGTEVPSYVKAQPLDYQPMNENIYIINNIFRTSERNNSIAVAVGAHGDWSNLKRGYKNIVIKDNVVSGATKCAFRFPHAESLTFEGNTITDTPLAIRYVSTSQVLDTESITIKNNKFVNVNEGVLIGAYKTDRRIKNAIITNNSFIGNNTAKSVGLKVEYTKSMVESGNTFSKFSMYKNLPGEIGKVNVTTLNMRSGPSTKYSIMRKLSKDTRVEIISKSGSWYKIRIGGKVGYVSSIYITKIGSSIRK